MMVRILLIIIMMWGCDNPHKVISDAGQDIPDVPEDVESDIQDVPDVQDADVTDTTDATEITEDPDEVLITCDKKRTAILYPWMYGNHYATGKDGSWTIAWDKVYRYNFETRMEEQLPDLDKMGGEFYSCVNSVLGRKYSVVRAIRYIVSPSSDGEYGQHVINVTDIDTGISWEIYYGMELLSEDCLNYDLYSGTGKASLHVWKMSNDETQALLACTTEYGMDIYRYNFTTSDITYLFRGSLESSPSQPNYNGYYFSDLGDDFISQTFRYSNTGFHEIRAWNWKTEELLWTNDSNNIAGVNVKAAEDGWVYYTYIEHLETGNYLNLASYNVLTGEEGATPPLVMENIYDAFPAVKGRPELIFFSGGDGPITSSEPRIPTGRKYYYLWDRNTDVVRRITLLPISYGSGGLVGGQVPPVTAFYSRQGGSYPCYYHKNLYEAGIMDINGNLLPEN